MVRTGIGTTGTGGQAVRRAEKGRSSTTAATRRSVGPIEPAGNRILFAETAEAPIEERPKPIDPYRIPEPPPIEQESEQTVSSADADSDRETTRLVYDDTFDGFLTAVFLCYSEHENSSNVEILPESRFQPDIFSTEETIVADRAKVERIRRGILRHLRPEQAFDIYATFLGESTEREELMLDYIRKVFATDGAIAEDYLDATARRVRVWGRRLQREKHRYEAFVRFGTTSGGEDFALVEPEYDLLPLLAGHFRDRFEETPWVIYDVRRSYGIHFDGDRLQEVTLEGHPKQTPTHLLDRSAFDPTPHHRSTGT